MQRTHTAPIRVAQVLTVLLLLGSGPGCNLPPDVVRRIEGTPGQEGTGITLTRLPRAIKILATYEATPAQRDAAAARARAIQSARATAGVPLTAADRYLAVETDADERSRGAASVMLWDTQTEQIVGNNVYDIESRPEPGEVAMWDTYPAEYVGTRARL